jgi:hypothetical protein
MMTEFSQATSGRIFISYRRAEAAADYSASWVYERLVARFGRDRVFKDVYSIEPGDDFGETIAKAVGSSEVLLAFIGPQWATITDETGRRRLDRPDDFVRLEIEAALQRDVRVIPILVGGASMPRPAQLPPSLSKLASRQALELSPARFEFDTARLLQTLESPLRSAAPQERSATLRVTPGLQGTPEVPGGLPEMTVTMLGDPGSGKTTFLLGMYAVLSSGYRGFSLQARTLDTQLDLADAWNAIVDAGRMPPPTAQLQSYPLVLKDGLTPVALIDWKDYRGGAINDRSSEPGVTDLWEQIRKSDIVYLAVNAAHLLERLDGTPVSTIERLIGSRRIQMLLMYAARERMAAGKAMPAMIIVITKADLLSDKAKTSSQAQDQIFRCVREVFPICFADETTSLLCSVSLGNLGSLEHKRAFDPDVVNPRQLHKPILCSALWFLQRQRNERTTAVIERLGKVLSDTPTLALNEGYGGWIQ